MSLVKPGLLSLYPALYLPDRGIKKRIFQKDYQPHRYDTQKEKQTSKKGRIRKRIDATSRKEWVRTTPVNGNYGNQLFRGTDFLEITKPAQQKPSKAALNI
jgi:hypothetical protein